MTVSETVLHLALSWCKPGWSLIASCCTDAPWLYSPTGNSRLCLKTKALNGVPSINCQYLASHKWCSSGAKKCNDTCPQSRMWWLSLIASMYRSFTRAKRWSNLKTQNPYIPRKARMIFTPKQGKFFSSNFQDKYTCNQFDLLETSFGSPTRCIGVSRRTRFL